MNPIKNLRRGSGAYRRDGRVAIIGAVIGAAVLLAVVLPGCGSSAPATNGTPSPTATTATVAASIAPVWASVKTADTPLFSLVVVQAQGFTAAERKYLSDLNITWSTIGNEATQYAALVGSGGDPAAAASLAKRIGRQASAAAAKPSPSARFAMLHMSARLLLRRVARLSLLTQAYTSTTDEAQKTAIGARILRAVAPLSAEVLRVSDWGLVMRNRYGGTGTAAVWSTSTTPTPTPTPSSSSTPGPNPTSTSNPNPTPTSTSTPKPSPQITAAEARQIDALTQLDSWLTVVIDETNSTLDNHAMPWSDSLINSFCLNMSYLEDQTTMWINTKWAGPHIKDAYLTYRSGLERVRAGATKLDAAARDNDADAATAGQNKLNSATPYLEKGMREMQALR
jgi:hypothetical protein